MRTNERGDWLPVAATGMGRSSLYVTDADHTAAEAHAPTGLRHPVQGVDQQLAADVSQPPQR